MEKVYSLSPMQQGMFFHEMLSDENVYYNQIKFEIKGELSYELFCRSVQVLTDSHEVLRTRYVLTGEKKPQQIIMDSREQKVELHDCSRMFEEAYNDKIKMIAEIRRRSRIDLSSGDIMHMDLFKISEEHFVLLWGCHHIALDGWCMSILIKELFELYKRVEQGNSEPLDETPYSSYLEWAENYDSSSVKKYWSEYLENAPSPFSFTPTNKENSTTGVREVIRLDFTEEQTNRLKEIAAAGHYTPSTLIQGLWGLLLCKYSNSDSAIWGCITSGRSVPVKNIRNIVGLFINTMPVIINLEKEKSLPEQLKKLGSDIFKAEMYNKIQLSEITEGKEALFRSIFAFENLEFTDMLEGVDIDGFKIENPVFYDRTNYSLAVKADPGNVLRLDFEYDPSVYEAGTIEQISSSFRYITEQFLENQNLSVRDYHILTDEEEKEVINSVNSIYDNSLPTISVQEKLRDIAEKYPDKEAVKGMDGVITYREFIEKADSAAAYLLNNGVKPGEVIGIAAENSVRTITAIFGILFAGCAYMPLDELLPKKRRMNYIKLGNAKTVISSHPEIYDDKLNVISAVQLLSENNYEKQNIKHSPEDTAYIIFTSGSTGEPKGVRVSTGALCRFGSDLISDIAGAEGDVVSQISTLSFDASVYEIFTALLTGGTLAIASHVEKEDTAAIIDFFERYSVTRTFLTTQLFKLIVDDNASCFKNMRKVVTGGEKASKQHFEKSVSLNKNTDFINAYGPTEIVSISSGYALNASSSFESVLPIGNPKGQHSYYVLDSDLHIMPKGIPGELYIGGIISDGYVNNEKLNRESFIPNPYEEGNLFYKTGDIVYLNSEGITTYLKRNDEQVKIRGYRIETGEIENALRDCKGVQDCCVNIIKNVAGNWKIQAYYTSDSFLEKENILSELEEILPSYMIPDEFMQLKKIPMTKNGKADRKNLPEIKNENQTMFVLPQNELQQQLLEIWQQVLGSQDIGIRHNFFEAGGDSIKAMQIIGLMKKIGLDAEIKMLFEHPTIERFAEYVRIGEIEVQETTIGETELMPIQKHFFSCNYAEQDQFNQSVLLRSEKRPDAVVIEKVMNQIVSHHDALRMIYTNKNGEWKQFIRPVNTVSYEITEAIFDGEGVEKEWLDYQIKKLQKNMSIEEGKLINIGVFSTPSGEYLFIAVHHLVMDGISFRILLRDFQELYTALSEGNEAKLIPAAFPYQKYSKAVSEAQKEKLPAFKLWERLSIRNLGKLSESVDKCRLADRTLKVVTLGKEVLEGASEYVNAVRGTDLASVLLGVSAYALNRTFDIENFSVDVEHNGRNFDGNKYDVSNTIGWFTAIYPIIFRIPEDNIETVIRNASDMQKKFSNISCEYMMKKTADGEKADIFSLKSGICFNYLGDFSSVEQGGEFKVVTNAIKSNRSSKQETDYLFEINTLTIRGELIVQIEYSNEAFSEKQIEKFVDIFAETADRLRKIAEEKQYEPFGLSSLQMAYFIGKQDFYELGGFTTHNYIEFLTKVDIPRLNVALQKIIDQQDMLHTLILPDGTQHVMKEVPRYEIKIEDLRALSEEQQQERIKRRREQLSHSFFDIQKFPLFEIDGFRINDEEKYLFISYDLIMLDSASVNLLVQDLAKYYFNPEIVPEKLKYHYRDYIHDLEEMREQPIFRKAKDYWLSKLETFPEAPQLPMLVNSEDIEKGHFKRYRHCYSPEEVDILKQESARHRMTLSALLLSVYAHTLNLYSGMDKFAINLTLFNRPQFHPDIERMYGDFSSTVLLDFDLSEGKDFWEESEKVQVTLGKALEYRIYDGMQFSRDLMHKFRYPKKKAMMPIVFTSLLFERDVWGDIGRLGEVKWSIGQTPQVYIDFDVMIEGGNLFIQMDYVTELFDGQMMRDFFDAYCNMLDQVCMKKEKIDTIRITEREMELRRKYNDTNEESPREGTLIELFAETADAKPDRTAVIGDTGEKITYNDLDRYSDRVAEYLEKQGYAGKAIGVYAEKKIGSIINIIGILKAGGHYVPMLPDYPKERVDYICRNSSIDKILYPKEYIDLPDAESKERRFMPTPEDTAYILYTSGSTGKPKGVEILNRTVTNTIIGANEAYQVTEDDVVIGLSSLCFDMSVFDIFGTFAAGASLVLVPDVHEIEKVAEMVDIYGVTLWQSVPALMQMYMSVRKDGQGKSLKTILLGGDFIPKLLAKSILTELPDAHFISVGGPTETSIFDIYYPVTEIKDEWNSIPYGIPLKNQQIYVLDSHGRDCPAGVKGEICVGGMGVGKGYVNEPELTAKSFCEHPVYGRIFRTGDYGIFHEEGYVEICGRIDGQVKIQGFRIELGEIENVFLKHPSVTQAVALIHEAKNGSKQIAVFIETSDENTSVSDYMEYAASYLTSYMRPSIFRILDKIPLTLNNKINRIALRDMLSQQDTSIVREITPPQNEMEEKLLEIWKRVLKVEEAGTDDDFFENGGDSLKAMELLAAIKKEMSWKNILLTDILKYNNIRELSKFYLSGGKSNILRELSEISPEKEKIFFIHGGNGSADSYVKIVDKIKESFSCYGIDYTRDLKLVPEVIDLKKLAREYAEAVLSKTNSSDKIYLAGWCIGGTIAYEIAYVLEKKGYSNIQLIMLDTQVPGIDTTYDYSAASEYEYIKAHNFGVSVDDIVPDGSVEKLWEDVIEKITKDEIVAASVKKSFIEEASAMLVNPEQLSIREIIMINNLFRSMVDGAEKVAVSSFLQFTKAVYIHARSESSARDPENWERHFRQPFKLVEGPGTHFSLIDEYADFCTEWIKK